MPKGPRTLRIVFGAETLTQYGGVYLLHRFLTRIGFKHAMAQDIRLVQRNNRYSVGEMFLAVLYPMILGLERIEPAHLLKQNGVFQYLAGLLILSESHDGAAVFAPRGADGVASTAQTARSTANRDDGTPASAVASDLRCGLHRAGSLWQAGARPDRIQPDQTWPAILSSTALLRGAEQRLLARRAAARRCPHSQRHPRTSHRVFREDSHWVRSVIIRADKGFYDHTLIEWLEAQKAGFVIVARLTAPIKRKLAHLRYVSLSRGIEIAEFHYQPIRWPHPSRFVVIRRPQPDDPTDQLTLFKLSQYHYQVLVTNLPLQPLTLWRFYNDRAGVELLIKQLKGDYALGSIPSRHFSANETYFHLLLLTYNLLHKLNRASHRSASSKPIGPPATLPATKGTDRSSAGGNAAGLSPGSIDLPDTLAGPLLCDGPRCEVTFMNKPIRCEYRQCIGAEEENLSAHVHDAHTMILIIIINSDMYKKCQWPSFPIVVGYICVKVASTYIISIRGKVSAQKAMARLRAHLKRLRFRWSTQRGHILSSPLATRLTIVTSTPR